MMGLFEVLPHIPRFMGHIHRLAQLAKLEQIDALITIDSPDFTLRVAKKIKKQLDIPCIHWVSPQVWAWRAGRVKKMAQYLDHVLALFPFEPAAYEKSGLQCTFVGHPVIQRMEKFGVKAEGLSVPPRLAVLPGSRGSELKRIAPLFADVVRLLQQKLPDLEVVLPVAELFKSEQLLDYFRDIPHLHLVQGQEKFAALKDCDAALTKSGTSNLELACLGIPHVVAYKTGSLTYKILKKLVKVPYISPVNLVAGASVVPEFLQDRAYPAVLANALLPLLANTPLRQKQRLGLEQVREALSTSGKTPAQRAAGVVLAYL
jgi:lipid-A-disaccharide synthase